ncbi:3-keto-disaccharide hydrolase [Blastopirellula retiformator]|uniref:3-keto-alpha-glucoside-1,2-lyase/3-keto-2-hydroxy-glucal hydratase domain-containing protein n=1 Tax=Blastopirellula retiformator TaxID=2527970 RepID=A0A5C5VLK8_9BACT|nr:DUF1080 domain-containing protein [Blastopirellula retiformator]TWT38735.1 hypothetical protein Enr8_04290 [Blastopirellula retiformator]
MSRLMPFRVLFSLLLLTCVSILLAGPAYTDTEKAGEDYDVQGEYEGVLGPDKVKIAAQVIAKGKGKFHAIGMPGGLPGDGLKPDEKKVEADGEREGEMVVFRTTTENGDEVRAEIKDGVMTVFGGDNQKVMELAKVFRESPTIGAKPPMGAVVLFDGTNLDAWMNAKMTEDGRMQQGATSKQLFDDHTIHLEFLLPFMPEDNGQARGNSGLYLQGRYEVQMLDSFGLSGENNECGGIYELKKPDVNMCLPPLRWQTYDIDFTAAKYGDDGKVKSAPRITVKHNGVLIHDDVQLPADKTTRAAPVAAGKEPGPVYLQNHGNPVRYRNIWVKTK